MSFTVVPNVINGVFDLYYTTVDGSNDIDTAGKKPLGCLQEGFEIGFTPAGDDVNVDCAGESAVDGIMKGFSNVRLNAIITEFTPRQDDIEHLVWPGGSNWGADDRIGNMALRQKRTHVLIAERRTGGAWDTEDFHNYWFFGALMRFGEEATMNFNISDQVMPVSFRLFRLLVADADTPTKKVYFPSDDTSALSTSTHTFRYFDTYDPTP
mgnify:CR=1 FL=1